MATMKSTGDAGTVEINDQEYVVQLGNGGDFYIKDGESYIGSGKSLDSAVASARKQLTKNKVKVSVPYLACTRRAGTFQFVPYRVFGWHRGNSAYMIKADRKGAPTEYQSYGSNDWAIDTPEEVQKRYLELYQQQREIARHMKELEQEHQVSIRELYEKAVEEAATIQLEEQ